MKDLTFFKIEYKHNIAGQYFCRRQTFRRINDAAATAVLAESTDRIRPITIHSLSDCRCNVASYRYCVGRHFWPSFNLIHTLDFFYKRTLNS